MLIVGAATRVQVQAVYPFDLIDEAFAAFAGGTLGKLVVSMAPKP